MIYIRIDNDFDLIRLLRELSERHVISLDTLINIIESFRAAGVIIERRFTEPSARNLNKPEERLDFFVKKNISNADIETIFENFFSDTRIGNDKVTIADQYIFSNGVDVQLLSQIIVNNITSKKVRFLYNPKRKNQSVLQNLQATLMSKGFQVDLDTTTDLHDRYWYSKNGGFLVCASFNTLSKSPTIIKPLDSDELHEIQKYYGV